MPEQWIVDASPLIVLARIGMENIFFTLANRVVVPQAVAMEIEAGPSDDQARRVLNTGRFPIVPTPPPPADLLAWDLGSGETAVLSMAVSETGWIAILDDAAARKCARSFSVPIKGTLALVLMAKQRGLIPSAGEVLRSLRTSGFHLNDKTVREALKRIVDEEW